MAVNSTLLRLFCFPYKNRADVRGLMSWLLRIPERGHSPPEADHQSGLTSLNDTAGQRGPLGT